MLDIRFIRENPEAVKENIQKKFQDSKLPLVDEVIDLDAKRRAAIAEADQLRPISTPICLERVLRLERSWSASAMAARRLLSRLMTSSTRGSLAS